MTARGAISTLLAALAGLLIVLGATAWSLDRGVVAEDAFADKAVEALHHDDVRRAVSAEILTQVSGQVPAGVVSEAQLRTMVDRTVRGAAFERVFRQSAVSANRALFHDDGTNATIQVSLASVLRPTSPQLADLVGDRSVTVLRLGGSGATDATNRAGLAGILGVALPFWAAAALIAALLVAPRRSRAIGAFGLGAAVGGGLLLAAAYAARSRAQDAIDLAGVGPAQARAAAAATWSVYTADTRLIALVAVAAGLLLLAVSLVTRSRRAAAR